MTTAVHQNGRINELRKFAHMLKMLYIMPAVNYWTAEERHVFTMTTIVVDLMMKEVAIADSKSLK